VRQLALLTLVALAALPLSAHGGWHGPRRVVVVEAPCRPDRYWEHERHERREHRGCGWGHRYDCDPDRVVMQPMLLPRPLPPPFQGRVELWIR